MSITVVGSEYLGGYSGSAVALTVPAGATGLVVMVIGGGYAVTGGEVGGPSDPLVLIDKYPDTGAVYGSNALLWCADITTRVADTLTITRTGGTQNLAVLYFSADVPLLLDNANAAWGIAGVQDFNAAASGAGNTLSVIVAHQWGHGVDAAGDSSYVDDSGANAGVFAYEASIAGDDSSEVTVDAYGGSYYGNYVWAVIYESAVTPVIASRFGIGMGFLPGLSVALTGAVVVQYQNRLGIRMGFRHEGRIVRIAAQRQVAFVGGDLDTPEMSENGDEGDVLMQHAGRSPSWESLADQPLSRWREPVRMDTDGDGVYDDWLLDDDGDIVMMEVIA